MNAAHGWPALHRSSVAKRLTTVLVGALACLTLWLAWISLGWPLIGDAAMFHFAAAQFLAGAVPYRDFIDMNMPLIYLIHAAIILAGGMGDLAFRLFDLGSVAVVAALAAALVWPAGPSRALLAALTITAAHLLFGPQAAGERDLLLMGPALAAALLVALATERPDRRNVLLLAAGVAVGMSVLLKPTAAVLIALPACAMPRRWREGSVAVLGFGAVGLVAVLALAAIGSLRPFLTDFRTYVPYYAQLAHRSLPVLALVAGKYTTLAVGGLALAALAGLRGRQSPRARAMIALMAFGALHFLVQGKGLYYHAYPLIVAMACFGAWSMARLPVAICSAVALLSLVDFGARGVQALANARLPGDAIMPAPASRAMQASLSSRLPTGARVQMLDMSGGAFLAMARAGMVQATPFAYWLFLAPGEQPWRDAFVADLQSAPPSAILVTDSTWPSPDGFQAVDAWPTLTAELACCYRLVESRTIAAEPYPWAASSPSVSWRLYARRGPDETARDERGSRTPGPSHLLSRGRPG